MNDDHASDSALAAAGDTAGSGATEAFALLGNETRLGVLLALWEAYDPDDPAGVVSFSQLRKDVGVTDSGQFNYHLRKLEGTFVEATDGGYRLLPIGLALVQTVIAGTGRQAALAPTEIAVECWLCGSPTVITYREGWLSHRCPDCEGGFVGDGRQEGVLFQEPFPAAALAGRTPEEVFAAGVYRLLRVVASKMDGVCPRCSGTIASTIDVCDDHDAAPGRVCEACGNASDARLAWVCTVCKYSGGSSPGAAVIVHPPVVAFYHEHGVDLGYPSTDFASAREVLERMRAHQQEVVSTDPLRIRVTIDYDDDRCRLLLDESMDVIDLER